MNCIICGNKLTVVETAMGIWQVYCERCDTYGPMAYSRKEAIDKWNKQYSKENDICLR